MKKLLLLLFLTATFSLQAQFNIDVARDSIISMQKIQSANGKWRIEIKSYIGISDTLSNAKSYSLFILQEDTEILIDSVINVLEAKIENERKGMLIQWQKAESQRVSKIRKKKRLNGLAKRLMQNKVLVQNMKN